jgi:hypothetical protein
LLRFIFRVITQTVTMSPIVTTDPAAGISPEALELALALAKEVRDCMWWWHTDATVENLEDASWSASTCGKTVATALCAGRNAFGNACNSLPVRGTEGSRRKPSRGEPFCRGLVRNATIAYALGLPLEQAVFSPEKRPFTVADKGRPMLDLFA